jgi:hypothetical protein
MGMGNIEDSSMFFPASAMLFKVSVNLFLHSSGENTSNELKEDTYKGKQDFNI